MDDETTDRGQHCVDPASPADRLPTRTRKHHRHTAATNVQPAQIRTGITQL